MALDKNKTENGLHGTAKRQGRKRVNLRWASKIISDFCRKADTD